MTEESNDFGNPLQRNSKWFSDRVGCLTASRMADALAVLKSGKPAAAQIALHDDIMAERLTGEPVTKFVNAYMQWGTEHEDEARQAYECATGNFVDLVGFVRHPSIDWFGASPDGTIGEDGLVEIKCPTTQSHINYVLAGVVPDKYKPQMICQLLCTGRKWVDFVSYDPRIKNEAKRLFIVRYQPTEEEKKAVENVAKAFLAAVAESVKKFSE